MTAIGEQTKQRWAEAGIEPSLQEIMGDPIVHLVMRRDRLTPADVWRIIADVQTAPQSGGRRLPHPSDSAAPEAEAASLRQRQVGLTNAY